MNDPKDVTPPSPLDYTTARQRASSPDPKVRVAVATLPETSPEILYFLAVDADPEVRAMVAANMACPVKGNLLLADDPVQKVRAALAAKVGRQQQPKRGGVAAQVLDRLAEDSVAEVRAIIAEALKNVTDADPALINRLARDAEIIVAVPILECSTVLTDQDLLDIIAGNPAPGALSAISRRNYIDASVTSAIVATHDSPAITNLLKNGNAQLKESVLDSLIEQSVHEPTWQEPLVYRPELNQRSASRLAEVVAMHLLDRILARQDLPPETIHAVAKIVGERLRQQAALPKPGPSAESIEKRYAARVEKARIAFAKGKLDELTLMVMLLTDPTEDMVVALAARSGLPVKSVLDMVEAQSPRAACALSWAAGLTAVFAAEMQIRLIGLPLDKVLEPDANGGYLLKDTELRWQLAMFGAIDKGLS